MFIDLLATAAIGGYQRFISPYKGFCCAYRFHTGRRSCSAYARVIVERLGALALRDAMPRQFERCRAAFAALQKSDSGKRENKRWWEHCDCNPCDLLSCGDLPCDCSP
jgi:putative component of membrane protein insertase Oxa1/YidC/SpoIIIJ protein YidD